MGEYIVYYKGKVVGGIYDDRFLVKPTKSAVSMIPSAVRELPYEGAKEMLLVEDIDDRSFLESLLNAMVEELPQNKKGSSSIGVPLILFNVRTRLLFRQWGTVFSLSAGMTRQQGFFQYIT